MIVSYQVPRAAKAWPNALNAQLVKSQVGFISYLNLMGVFSETDEGNVLVESRQEQTVFFSRSKIATSRTLILQMVVAFFGFQYPTMHSYEFFVFISI